MGVWIDHRKAIILAVTHKGERMKLILSDVEKQLRRSGDSPLKGPNESQKVPAVDSRRKPFAGHPNTYYDAIIAFLRNAESILIFGPGEAKSELKKRLKKDKLDGRIVGIETVDRMTANQIVVKVRGYFRKQKLQV